MSVRATECIHDGVPFQALEREGVEKFIASWSDLLASVGSELTGLRAEW